jgi:hypothetical protein
MGRKLPLKSLTDSSKLAYKTSYNHLYIVL